jgi:triphosphatase
LAAIPTETELKLVCTPAALRKLTGSTVLDAHAVGEPATDELAATYFDTPDDRLARRRLSLRVRRNGQRRIQTLKAGGASLDSRGEWEVEISGDEPDLGAFGDPRVSDLVGAVLPGELVPRYATEITRRAVPVAWIDGQGRPGRAIVAFDLGRIVADHRVEPLAEVEIELVAGSEQAIYELAGALRRVAPLRIGGLSKAARGHALVTGRPPRPRKAGRLVLDHDSTVEQAMLTIFRRCVAHAVMNEAPAMAGVDPEGVHQLRVALRRLRSALSLLRDAIPEPARRRWAAEARWLLGCLGPCRDLDVLLDDLVPGVSEALGDEASRLAGFVDLARAGQQRAHGQVSAALAGRRCGDLFLGLACWAEEHRWREAAGATLLEAQQAPVTWLAERILDRLHRRVRKRGRGFARLDAKARHKLRLAVKKLRYGLEFFAGLYGGKRVAAYLDRLADLQESLGHQNDIAVSRRLVERIADSAPPEQAPAVAFAAGLLAGWQSRRAVGLEAQLAAHWDSFREAHPCWRETGAAR